MKVNYCNEYDVFLEVRGSFMRNLMFEINNNKYLSRIISIYIVLASIIFKSFYILKYDFNKRYMISNNVW